MTGVTRTLTSVNKKKITGNLVQHFTELYV